MTFADTSWAVAPCRLRAEGRAARLSPVEAGKEAIAASHGEPDDIFRAGGQLLLRPYDWVARFATPLQTAPRTDAQAGTPWDGSSRAFTPLAVRERLVSGRVDQRVYPAVDWA